MRKIDSGKTVERIVNFIRNYANLNKIDSLVVGVSGGVDSALVSTLCAMTGFPTYPMIFETEMGTKASMRAYHHCKSLSAEFDTNVVFKLKSVVHTDQAFTSLYDRLRSHLGRGVVSKNEKLAKANLASRLYMAALYYQANDMNGIVVGTGNLVEDYGVGFFTKYGDGGVDISPIGGLYKSEVYQLAKHVGVSEAILEAAPEDGLWEDGRTDEDQLGVSYARLEAVMEENRTGKAITDEEATSIYMKRHLANKHKMEMPTVCSVEWEE